MDMNLAGWGPYSTRDKCFPYSVVHLLVFHLIQIHSLPPAPNKLESFVKILMDVADHLAAIYKEQKIIFFCPGELAQQIILVFCSPVERHVYKGTSFRVSPPVPTGTFPNVGEHLVHFSL